jgi:hypothetical protein
MNPIWPSSPSEVVLWAQLVSVWIVAIYGVLGDWTTPPTDSTSKHETARIVGSISFVALAAALLPPPGTSSPARFTLAMTLAGAVAAMLAIRQKLVRVDVAGRRWLPELEIGATIGVALVSGAAIGLARIGGLRQDAIIRGGKAASILCVIAAIAFVFRGGTSIVRAVLDKAGAKPMVRGTATESPAPEVDFKEFNRGRSIGNLERLLMILVISLGSYEALGFLIAAKGLIRAREFENRDFAEYFILGSLTSAAIAMCVGLALRFILPILWKS